MTSPGSANKYSADTGAFVAAANTVHRETDNILTAVNTLQNKSMEILPTAVQGNTYAAGMAGLEELFTVVRNKARDLHAAADHHTQSANQTAAMDQQHQAAVRKATNSMLTLNTTPAGQ